jgi:NDP-sugar pyrophosphorylase family protein
LLADPRSHHESRVPVVLMAGGLGRRLRPLTDTCPKPMLRLGGRPLLERIIERFIAQGFREFHISVNYLGHQIEEYFGNGERMGCSISYIRERRQLGTAGALSLLPAELEGPFVVMNGDLLTEVDFQALVKRHQDTGYAATMCVREHATTVPFGVVEMAEGGRYRAMVEKPTLVHHVNAGIYCLSREALYVVPNDRFYDMPSLFQDLDLQGRTCGVHVVGGLLLDIGTPVEFERAQDMFKDGGAFATPPVEAGQSLPTAAARTAA